MNRILFIDDAQIASSRDVERKIHPARRYHGNPVVTSDCAWEAAEVIVGTVRKEAERYRMWYHTYATGPGRNGFDPFLRSLHLYAESADGPHVVEAGARHHRTLRVHVRNLRVRKFIRR